MMDVFRASPTLDFVFFPDLSSRLSVSFSSSSPEPSWRFDQQKTKTETAEERLQVSFSLRKQSKEDLNAIIWISTHLHLPGLGLILFLALLLLLFESRHTNPRPSSDIIKMIVTSAFMNSWEERSCKHNLNTILTSSAQNPTNTNVG